MTSARFYKSLFALLSHPVYEKKKGFIHCPIFSISVVFGCFFFFFFLVILAFIQFFIQFSDCILTLEVFFSFSPLFFATYYFLYIFLIFLFYFSYFCGNLEWGLIMLDMLIVGRLWLIESILVKEITLLVA